MTDFEKKLPLYKTAYSPMMSCYVSIKKIRIDTRGEYILDCETGNKERISFRVTELINFCL